MQCAASPQPQQPFNVVALGNLCVDVFVPVESLPPPDDSVRQELLQRLTGQFTAPDENWEVGGNCNFLIAAARLGMRTGTVGHTGGDVYGNFLQTVLKVRAGGCMGAHSSRLGAL